MCWRVTLTDATQQFFTGHDVDLVIDGDTYRADAGTLPTAQDQSVGLDVDNAEITSFLYSSAIDRDDIRYGRYNGASVDMFLVNYEDLTMGVLYRAKEWLLGNIELNDNKFTTEIRSKAARLQQSIIDVYKPACDAVFGDARCGIDLDDSAMTYRYDGAVSVALSNRQFLDLTADSRFDDPEMFRWGRIVWATPGSGDAWPGLNAGRVMEIKKFTVTFGIFELFLPMPEAITIGDQFTAYMGCARTREACVAYDNIVNFRGFPDIPGRDKLLIETIPPSTVK